MYASRGAADSAKDRYTQKSLFWFFCQLLPDIALSVSDTLTPPLDQFLIAVSIIQWEKCCTNCIFLLLFCFNSAFSNKPQHSSVVTETKAKKTTTQGETTIKEDKFAQSRLVVADRGAGRQAGGTLYCLCVPGDQLLPLPTPLNHCESLFIGEL